MDTIIALLGLISLFCFLGSLILLVLFLLLKKPKKPILLGLAISFLVFIITFTIDSDSAEEIETSQVVKEEVDNVVESDETNNKSREEINQELINEAIGADFVEINGGNWEGKVVYIEGEISVIYDDGIFTTFTISQQESEDGYGVYSVQIPTICIEQNLTDGDIIKVYGRVDGRDSTGLPQISSTYLTKTK